MSLQQTLVGPSQKFKCLEDRLLQALYTTEGPVSLQELAAPIEITPNAALSIAHRIKRDYPQYLHLQEDELVENSSLYAVSTESDKVHQFLNEGGFTKLNEEEFLKYYEKELKREKRQAQLRVLKAKIRNERWAIGISLVVAISVVSAVYLHKKNNQDISY